jgi:hypothetical protein
MWNSDGEMSESGGTKEEDHFDSDCKRASVRVARFRSGNEIF